MKPIRYIVDKEDGKPYTVLNPELRQRELDALPKGRYRETIEKFYRKSTPLQFGYLYGLIYPKFLLAAWDAGYTTDDFKDVEELDLWCRARWANKPVTNRDTGEVIKVPLSKAEFITIDQMAYCNILRTFASEYLGIYIEEPDSNWKNKKK